MHPRHAGLPYTTYKKTLLRSINQLKKRDNIVITKPDKGTCVVIIHKTEYTKILNEESINSTDKFKSVSQGRPKWKGRPPKHYNPLLRKEKELETAVTKILPKGPHRYKKLELVTNSDTEIFQHVISEQIRDIPDAIDISDDIIISG